MDDQPGEPAEDPAPARAAAPDGPEARALAHEAEEIRRLVEAGAGSPEDLRLLAARIREHRAREEALWRSQVKPQLVKARKASFSLGRSAPAPAGRAPAQRNAGVGGALLAAALLVVVLAATTTIAVLVVPLVGLLAYAWWQGRQGPPPD